MAILEVKNISKVYTTRFGSTKVQALSNMNFSVEEGEYVAIMGESGSGKTTLLNILASLDKPTGGEVLLNGKNMTTIKEKQLSAFRRDNLGFVFQDYKLLEHLTIMDNMILPLMLDHREVKESVSKVEGMARMLQIADKLDYYPNELSGGEKQRAAIGRALMNDPPLILADEPTGNLDEASGRMVMELLIRLQKDLHKTLVLVTHDKEIADFCSRMVMMKDGRLAG